ncbi:cytochrome aa3 quinol oxidase subunit II [Camelliibacillus cellulosilyticus]|uniref:Quinol oxidase subunit 2 n=1 Tax=Camelliibacillus cellulosilyticus TaxID=2174486 RepID=A0ABV9GNH6_9BACL
MSALKRKGTILAIIGLFLLSGCSERFPVLDPAGPVGETQYRLILISALLTLIVVIPVIILLIVIVIRYRDKPKRKAPYRPEWDDNKKLEIVWWAIPIIIIAVLGFFTVKTTYQLAKPPATTAEPLTIEVTSLDWKWLFTYPEQGVATVNHVEIPTGRPIQFVLTADAPMNSFWIPELGGQEYTMPGMAMRLWLQSNKDGVFTGKGANFTGKGFAHMSFKVHSKNQKDFDQWVEKVKASAPKMTEQKYQDLTKPSVVDPMSFSAYPKDLYKNIVIKNGGMHMNDWFFKENKMEHAEH